VLSVCESHPSVTMGACGSIASQMVAPPEESGPASMTIEVKVNCTTGCGGAVVDEMRSTFVDTLGKKTNNAITAACV